MRRMVCLQVFAPCAWKCGGVAVRGVVKHEAVAILNLKRVGRWNKYLPVINGRTQPVGRPLQASEVQVAAVRKLRKAGRSLRWIAEATSLGLNTVRTIVDKVDGTDRTSRKHRDRVERTEIDRQQAIRWKLRPCPSRRSA